MLIKMIARAVLRLPIAPRLHERLFLLIVGGFVIFLTVIIACLCDNLCAGSLVIIIVIFRLQERLILVLVVRLFLITAGCRCLIVILALCLVLGGVLSIVIIVIGVGELEEGLCFLLIVTILVCFL